MMKKITAIMLMAILTLAVRSTQNVISNLSAEPSSETSTSDSSDPTPPIWGGALRYSVNVSFLYDVPKMNWNFTYYYDWNVKAESYIHHAPQADEMCLLAQPPFGINDSCIATFATDGWSYIEYPEHKWCCKCGNTFGSVRSDWLSVNSSYQGTTTMDGLAVTHWTKQGASLNHYYSTIEKQAPVKFAELKNGKPKEWTFDLKSYNTGSFDPKILGPKCTNLCEGGCPRFRKNYYQTQQ